jgi:uncharacterized membrane protein
VPPRNRRLLAEGERLEDLLGGRVLAWVGGAAVLLGIVFLLAIAVSRGWLGEGARTLLAAVASGVLLAAGAWLHERRGRGDAARAATAAGLAGLFATLTVATQVYAIVPALSGATLAILVGSLATGLAIRWSSRGIAALGILGAVGAPLLTGAGHDGDVIVLLFVAFAAAAGVLLWRRWDWLGLAAFTLAAPQWVAYLFDGATTASSATLVLIAFGALAVAMAVGHDLRAAAAAAGVRSQQAFLLALNAIVLAVAGWFAFGELGSSDNGTAWLVGLAAVHLIVGLAGPRFAGVSHELRLLALTLGVLLADVAFAVLSHGWVQAAGWSAAGIAFAALARAVAPHDRDSAFVQYGLGGHLALSLVQALVVANPLEVLVGTEALSGAGAAAVAILATSCLTAGGLVREREASWRVALHAVGLASVALLSALALDGVALVLAWAGEGLVLAHIARRSDDPVAERGAHGFLALATLHALAFEAPPSALTEGLDAPLDALAAVGAAAALALVVSEWLPGLTPRLPLVLRASAAVGLLHLASGLLVTAFAGDQAAGGTLLTADQQSQLVLSVFWGLVGVATLVAGLRRDVRALRIGGLALLGVTVLKVFLLDLATLTSVYRVGSFVALGLLLLAAAFVWQRLRPRGEVREDASEHAEVDLERGVDGECCLE